MKISLSRENVIILIAALFGAIAFTIFISPAFIPDLPQNQIYGVLTNIMGFSALFSIIFFLYWAYRVSKRLKAPAVEESPGEFIFCTECELIEGRANICKACRKAGERK